MEKQCHPYKISNKVLYAFLSRATLTKRDPLTSLGSVALLGREKKVRIWKKVFADQGLHACVTERDSKTAMFGSNFYCGIQRK